MKRYNIVAKPWDSYSADWDSVESPDGEWVRYEDADRELRVAKATARDYHEALEELRARVTEACAALGSAGSSYGPMSRIANALEALRGRR